MEYKDLTRSYGLVLQADSWDDLGKLIRDSTVLRNVVLTNPQSLSDIFTIQVAGETVLQIQNPEAIAPCAPYAYYTGSTELNPPPLKHWVVAHGFARRHPPIDRTRDALVKNGIIKSD